MTRPLDPSNLVALPRLNAVEAITLARSLEAAAEDTAKTGRALPTNVPAALAEVKEERVALEGEVGEAGADSPPSEVRPADRREDTVVGALHDVMYGWARLVDEPEVPEGRIGADLYGRIFGKEGLSIVKLPVRQEWAVVESKLQLIDREQLEPALGRLGCLPLLAHLKRVHEAYGKAIGVTQVQMEETPAVRARREALVEALKVYVLRVVASVERRRPETQALADALLRPLREWQSRPVARREAEPEPPAGA